MQVRQQREEMTEFPDIRVGRGGHQCRLTRTISSPVPYARTWRAAEVHDAAAAAYVVLWQVVVTVFDGQSAHLSRCPQRARCRVEQRSRMARLRRMSRPACGGFP